MADKRISELQSLAAGGVQPDTDVIAIADISAAETKKITLRAAVEAGLAAGAGNIDGAQIQDRSIPGVKLELGAVTSDELAENSVQTKHIVDKACTTEKLADGAVTTSKIALGNVTGTEIAQRSIIGDYHIQQNSITAAEITQNTITADEIAPDAVGTSELAIDAVHTENILSDQLVTRHYSNLSVTNEKLASGIDGDKILNGSITADKISGSIGGDQIDSITLDKLPDAPVNTVLAGNAVSGTGTPTYRKLVPADLPTATTGAKGALSVPTDGGLSITGDGVGIANTVTPGGFPFVNFDKHGSITSGRALSGADLPPPALGQPGAVKPGDGLSVSGDGTLNVIPATDSTIGGVIAGDGITIAADGKISQSVTGVEAGTWTKVTVDEMGNVTEGALLANTDIPNIDWSQINNPEIDSGMLADDSVLRRHLADFSVMFIQEATPSVDSTVHAGCMWFRESTAGLHAWNGNSWMSIGQGRLSAENLRYSGIFDASTGLITGLTQFGVGEGYELGTAVPTATDLQTGVYFVAEVPGSGTLVTPGVEFDSGDWLLCNGAAAGWVRIDTMVGGGGGSGGASNLKDLLDVNVGSATTGALLQLQASGQWADTYGIDAGEF